MSDPLSSPDALPDSKTTQQSQTGDSGGVSSAGEPTGDEAAMRLLDWVTGSSTYTDDSYRNADIQAVLAARRVDQKRLEELTEAFRVLRMFGGLDSSAARFIDGVLGGVSLSVAEPRKQPETETEQDGGSGGASSGGVTPESVDALGSDERERRWPNGPWDEGQGPELAHAERVAANFPIGSLEGEVAFYHDYVEDGREDEVPATVLGDVLMLTRDKGDGYFDYILRIQQEGSAVAVAVKIADLRDNLARCRGEFDGKVNSNLANRYEKAIRMLTSTTGDVPTSPPTSSASGRASCGGGTE